MGGHARRKGGLRGPRVGRREASSAGSCVLGSLETPSKRPAARTAGDRRPGSRPHPAVPGTRGPLRFLVPATGVTPPCPLEADGPSGPPGSRHRHLHPSGRSSVAVLVGASPGPVTGVEAWDRPAQPPFPHQLKARAGGRPHVRRVASCWPVRSVSIAAATSLFLSTGGSVRALDRPGLSVPLLMSENSEHSRRKGPAPPVLATPTPAVRPHYSEATISRSKAPAPTAGSFRIPGRSHRKETPSSQKPPPQTSGVCTPRAAPHGPSRSHSLPDLSQVQLDPFDFSHSCPLPSAPHFLQEC